MRCLSPGAKREAIEKLSKGKEDVAGIPDEPKPRRHGAGFLRQRTFWLCVENDSTTTVETEREKEEDLERLHRGRRDWSAISN